MFKFLKSLSILIILFFVLAGTAKAALMLKGIDMPAYVNDEPFNITYTALETEGNPVEIFGYIKKDGSDWKEVGKSTKLSDTFKVDSTFLAGNGLYKIYFRDANSGETTPEESFNIDFTAPDPVSNYRKDRTDALVYKICWKNPDDEDFNRTIIYRSDKKEFTADSSTQITEIGGAKDEEKCFEDYIPQNKEYFYVTRTVDHAGNASSVVGDSEVIVTTVLGANVTVTPTPTTVGLPLAKVSPETTPTVEEGQILGGETSQAAEQKPGLVQTLNNKIVKFGFWKILGIIIIVLGIVILLVSLLKKRR